MAAWMFAVASSALQALTGAGKDVEQIKNAAIENRQTNEAIVQANIRNTVRTGYRVGIANLQRGLSRKLATQKGFYTTAAAQEALGAVTANQAASGTIGASADAVAGEVRMRLGEALAQQEEDFDIELVNFNVRLGEIAQEGASSMQGARVLNLPSAESVVGQAAFKAAIDFGSKYFGSKFDLGLGDQGGSTSGFTYYGR